MAVKDDVLLILEQNRGQFISGQKMADELSVSRNAVWKAIDRLKNDGYKIISGNGGYSLEPDCDRLINGRLSSLLYNDAADTSFHFYLYDSIDSTSNECKRRLSDGEKNFAVLAESQTNGRGRSGKAFFSPDEQGLYMSIALERNMPFADAVRVTTYTAVCVVEQIWQLTGRQCKIKWVNDVLYEGRKICGILSEAITDMETGMITDVVIGIGINLHPADLPEELRAIAGNLDCGPVKNELAAAIIKSLFAYDPKDVSHMEKYRAYSAVLGEQVKFQINGEVQAGKAETINDDGGLVVRTPTGLVTLVAGEISLLKPQIK